MDRIERRWQGADLMWQPISQLNEPARANATALFTPVWGAASEALSHAPSVPMATHVGAYCLRLMVVDRPRVERVLGRAEVRELLAELSRELVGQRGEREAGRLAVVGQ